MYYYYVIHYVYEMCYTYVKAYYVYDVSLRNVQLHSQEHVDVNLIIM